MIEQLLFFGLGCLVAALIWLILLPAFWRRSTRLARASIEMSLPLTPNEIAAEKDRLRAEHAVRLGLIERQVEAVRREIVAAKTETGERLKTEATFLETIADRDRKLVAREQLLGERQAEIDRLAMRFENLTEAHALAETTLAGLQLQRDALTAKLNSAVDLADERRLALDEARNQVIRLTEALESETRRNAELRADLQSREISMRELERRASTLENDVALMRIRRGEGDASESSSPERERVAKAS
jgi:chromosome segregation ATPase